MELSVYKPNSSLSDIFGELADTQVNRYKSNRLPIRNQKIGELAATNRLSSGLAQSTLNEFDRQSNQGEADIRAGVLPAIGQGTLQYNAAGLQDQLSINEDERKRQLAALIGSLNKPSKLSGILQGAGTGAAAGSSFGPYGAVIGGGLGAILGASS